MENKVQDLHGYIERIDQIKRQTDRMSGPKPAALAILEKRKATAERVKAIYGNKQLRRMSGGVLGTFNSSNREITINEEVLDNEKEALHVTNHEEIHDRHFQAGIDKIDLEKELGESGLKLLEETTNIKDLKKLDLIEGFAELKNQQEVGKNDKIAYVHKEVPAAEKLQALAEKHLNRSLLTAFTRSKTEFWDIMKSLVGVLQVKELLAA